MSDHQQQNEEVPRPPKESQAWGLAKEIVGDVGKQIASDTKATFKWALRAAIIGAIAVGGAGGWYFGLMGLAIGAVGGAIVGAIIGAICGYLLYLDL